MERGSRGGLYSARFILTANDDYESFRGLHNELLGLEDLNEYTKVAIKMAKENPPFGSLGRTM